ncbi:hypothetical protein SLNWT_0866 [Streptomyces albus]|uniref:Uncharacterized protein n=1 Tax=Streptomyces albus (strain ATCC 21838 / DSM 41398 / FERM P-419 / JCM 4703 / NBRC 107858) TaxID=1081613 RepID=A0A0B5ESX3_STRA4|nr:hypothetical protein SLNWT_0866 [Streptomyces albus]AOU75557.1 hypothetical protein SLNHY_0866 [Streptomyces albus]
MRRDAVSGSRELAHQFGAFGEPRYGPGGELSGLVRGAGHSRIDDDLQRWAVTGAGEGIGREGSTGRTIRPPRRLRPPPGGAVTDGPGRRGSGAGP